MLEPRAIRGFAFDMHTMRTVRLVERVNIKLDVVRVIPERREPALADDARGDGEVQDEFQLCLLIAPLILALFECDPLGLFAWPAVGFQYAQVGFRRSWDSHHW